MKCFRVLAAAVLLTLPCGAADKLPVTAASVVDKVTVSDDVLAWDVFRLGMALDEVRTLLGTALPLNAGSEGVKPTDRYSASLVHGGVMVHLSFESDDPSAALVYLHAGFPATDPNVEALTDRLRKRVPELEDTDASSSLLLPGTDHQAAVGDGGVSLGAVWLF